MISEEIIQEVVKRLVDVYNPLEIYLFGSYAWGHPDEESDLDLLIVVSESDKKRYKRSLPASYALKDLMVAKDVIVLTKKEFEKYGGDISTLSYKIKQKGKKVYASA